MENKEIAIELLKIVEEQFENIKKASDALGVEMFESNIAKNKEGLEDLILKIIGYDNINYSWGKEHLGYYLFDDIEETPKEMVEYLLDNKEKLDEIVTINVTRGD